MRKGKKRVQGGQRAEHGTSSGRSSRVASGRNTGHLTHRGRHWPGWPSQRRCPGRTLCWLPAGWHQVGRAGTAGLTLPGAMVRRRICTTTHIRRHTHSFFLLAYAVLHYQCPGWVQMPPPHGEVLWLPARHDFSAPGKQNMMSAHR